MKKKKGAMKERRQQDGSQTKEGGWQGEGAVRHYQPAGWLHTSVEDQRQRPMTIVVRSSVYFKFAMRLGPR
jgi:hypothetical protein